MVKEIESLFDTLYAHPAMARLCESCGAKKFNLNATDSPADSERLLERPAASLPEV
jgi:predicted  nucleic acid-binding Zn-ribbon protein